MSSIAVLAKAFCVLEVLARIPRPLALSELAVESRLPKPTIHRILRSLRDLGYVEQADRGSLYQLSGRLVSLREYGRDDALRQKVLPLMRQLHVAFNETVNLGMLEGIYVRYIHVLETTQPLRWIVKPGARDEFQTTALGRAILSELSAEQQRRLIAKVTAAGAARERKARHAKVSAAIDATRKRGIAIEEEETVAGVACLAIPLVCVGEPLAAISVSVPMPRFSSTRRAALIAALRQARNNPEAFLAQNLVSAG